MTLHKRIKKWFRLLKDILFPLFCIGCNEEGILLCESCIKKIPVLGIFCCPVCALATGNGKVCESCQSISSLDSVSAVLAYKDHSLSARLLHELKYNGIEEAEIYFEKIFHSFLTDKQSFFSSFDCIVPLPLHRRRYAERGFNQSEVLARILSREYTLPIKKIVKRVHFTRPQVGLSLDQRKKNVRSAFVVEGNFSKMRVLLVDDVFTTGSTMQECAKALKSHGVENVDGFVFARAKQH